MPILHAHSLKTRNILKSIIEQKLLRLSLEMLHIFHYLPKRTLKENLGSVPKKIHFILSPSEKDFLKNCKAKHV